VSSTKSSHRLSGAPTGVTSIPLTDAHPNGSSVGDLVKDATVQMSTLVRAEVALAKSELWTETKKALVGSVFFIIALVVALMSSIYFFFFFVALLHIWMPWWAASGVMFLVMVFLALLALGFGVWRVMKIRAPRKTISTLKQMPGVLPELALPGIGKSKSGAGGEHQRSSFTAPTRN